jgi:hypothetical protein
VAGCSCIAPTNPCPGVASGVNGPPGRAFQACDRWGHIGATPGPRTTGSQRTTPVNTGPPSAEVTGLIPPPAAGRRDPPEISDTEEITGSNPVAPTSKVLASGNAVALTITAPTQRRRWSLRCLGPVPQGCVPDEERFPCLPSGLLGPTRSSAPSNLHGRWPPFPDGPSPIGVVARVDLLYRWVRDSLHPSTGGPNPTAQTASCSLSVIQSRWVRRD